MSDRRYVKIIYDAVENPDFHKIISEHFTLDGPIIEWEWLQDYDEEKEASNDE